jgi:hypothetical protein
MKKLLANSLGFTNCTTAANENSDVVLGQVSLRQAAYDMNHSVLEWFDLRGRDLFDIIETATFCGPRSCLLDSDGTLLANASHAIFDTHELSRIQEWLRFKGLTLNMPFALKLSRNMSGFEPKDLLVCPIYYKEEKIFSVTVY